MPPKRRSQVSRTSSTGQQSTLSFHGKQNKVTKPSSAQQVKTAKKEQALAKDVVDIQTPANKAPTTADEAIKQQTPDETATLHAAPDPLDSQGEATNTVDVLGGRAPQSDAGATGGKGSGWVADEEEQARKVSDTQIKRYWRQKEQERLAPRIHQEDPGVYEKVLREWDMSNQYGPCIGIARLKRWKRANVLGLKPPIEVLAILLKEMESGEAKSQRAYVDELMTSRFVAET